MEKKEDLKEEEELSSRVVGVDLGLLQDYVVMKFGKQDFLQFVADRNAASTRMPFCDLNSSSKRKMNPGSSSGQQEVPFKTSKNENTDSLGPWGAENAEIELKIHNTQDKNDEIKGQEDLSLVKDKEDQVISSSGMGDEIVEAPAPGPSGRYHEEELNNCSEGGESSSKGLENGTKNSKMISKEKPNAMEEPKAALEDKEPINNDHNELIIVTSISFSRKRSFDPSSGQNEFTFKSPRMEIPIPRIDHKNDESKEDEYGPPSYTREKPAQDDLSKIEVDTSGRCDRPYITSLRKLKENAVPLLTRNKPEGLDLVEEFQKDVAEDESDDDKGHIFFDPDFYEDDVNINYKNAKDPEVDWGAFEEDYLDDDYDTDAHYVDFQLQENPHRKKPSGQSNILVTNSDGHGDEVEVPLPDLNVSKRPNPGIITSDSSEVELNVLVNSDTKIDVSEEVFNDMGKELKSITKVPLITDENLNNNGLVKQNSPNPGMTTSDSSEVELNVVVNSDTKIDVSEEVFNDVRKDLKSITEVTAMADEILTMPKFDDPVIELYECWHSETASSSSSMTFSSIFNLPETRISRENNIVKNPEAQDLDSGTDFDKKVESINASDGEDLMELPIETLEAMVWKHVFQFLDYESLKNIRSVNKLFHKVGSPILGKRSLIRIYCNHDPEAISTRSLKWKENYKKEKRRFESLQNLKKTLEQSLNPQDFFLNLVAHVDWLSNKCNIEAQNVLDDFGHHIKTFRVEDTRQVLGTNSRVMLDRPVNEVQLQAQLTALGIVLEKCPTLQSLEFVTTDDKEVRVRNANIMNLDEVLYFGIINFKFLRTFNLTAIQLSSNLSEVLSDFFISVLKVCPNLSKLRLVGGSYQRKSLSSDITFFEKLVKQPDITNKLEEFVWAVDKKDPFKSFKELNNDHILEIISRMKFSSKLKILRLDKSKDSQSEQGEMHLFQLLRKVAGSLEILDVSGRYFVDNQEGNNQDTEDFPRLEKLRVLKICSKNAYGFTNKSIVRLFPNLLTLWLSFDQEGGDGADFSRNKLDEEEPPGFAMFLQNAVFKQKNQHQNLKRLYLVDRNLQNPVLMKEIVQSFPNLELLWIGINSFRPSRLKGEHNLNLEDAMDFLVNLKQLKELSLFHNNKSSSRQVYIVLEVLVEKFKNLEKFSLNNRFRGTKIKPNTLLDCISSPECRINIQLFGYGLEEDKDGKKELKEYLKENRLTCKVLPFQLEYPSVGEY